MGLIFIIMIVVIIVLASKNNDLRDENNYLKNENNILRNNSFKNTIIKKINFCPKCGFDITKIFNQIRFCPKCGNNLVGSTQQNNKPTISSNNIVNSNQNVRVKEKHTDKEIKNSLILTTGSILVIFSAIVFLVSTWNIVDNIIKTIVLLLMLVVFFAVSYIAGKHLQLKQTSKTFYYIALCYIPIVLLSIPMFSLFGNYLSLYGEGRYLYLTISSILVSLIYYYSAKNRNSRLLFIFSIIFQLLSVIFFTLIFINNITALLLGLIIYNVIINMCYIMNKIYFNKKTHLMLSTILCSSTVFLLISENFISILLNNITILDVIAFIIMFFNIYLVLIKIWNKDSIYKFIYPILTILAFNTLSHIFDNMAIRQLLIVISFIIIYGYNLIKEQKINIISYIEILVSFSFLNIIWMIAGLSEIQLIDSYILFSIVTLLSLINYINDKKYKTFSSTMLGIGVVITTISIVTRFELSMMIVGCISFVLILISMLKNMDISLRKTFKWIGFSSLFIITLFNGDTVLYSLISYAIYSIVLLGYGLKTKDDIYKIFSYIYTNLSLFALTDFIDYNYSVYVIPLTTIIFTLLERFVTDIRSKVSDIYLILSYMLSMIILVVSFDIYGFITILIINLAYLYYVVYYNKNRNYLCASFIGLFPYIYLSDFLIINNFNMMYFISIIALVMLGTLIYYKKSNLYITMFYLYSFFHVINLEQINYVGILLLLLGSFVCYSIKNNKVKDIYKAVLYILCVVLYNTIISDLRIDNLTLLTHGIYIVLILLITRTILKKYGNGYKVWEYILSSIINLIVLGSYLNEYDGILYVVFLTIIVIVSYVYKYGPIFLVCLISILINVLILTRTIWLNIPWWLYILIIGGILIGFAIYNEVKDKNDGNKNKAKEIKKYLDL